MLDLRYSFRSAATSLPLIVAGITTVLGTSLFSYLWVTSNDSNTSRRSRRGFISGVYNIGNTCYINCLVQCLASSDVFVRWLREIRENSLQFSSELLVLLDDINDVSGQSESVKSAEKLVDALRRHGWHIAPASEQDCFELLNVIVSTLSDELRVIEKQPYSLLELCAEMNEINVPICSSSRSLPASPCGLGIDSFRYFKSNWASFAPRLQSPIEGLLATQLQCSRCGYKTVRHDTFCGLSLLLGKAFMRPRTLSCCLRQYFSTEVISDVTCDKCTLTDPENPTKSSFVKKQGISKTPKVLILHVQRATFQSPVNSLKNMDFVDFPEVLDIRDFLYYRCKNGEYAVSRSKSVSAESNFSAGDAAINTDNATILKDLCEQSRYKYRLHSVIEHLGSVDSGHYVTYRRGPGASSFMEDSQSVPTSSKSVHKDSMSSIPSLKWFYASDSYVRKASVDEVLGAQAYMLLYEKIL